MVGRGENLGKIGLRRAVNCADRDRISLGLLCGLHKGGYCADRDRISLGLLCGLHKGGGVLCR